MLEQRNMYETAKEINEEWRKARRKNVDFQRISYLVH